MTTLEQWQTGTTVDGIPPWDGTGVPLPVDENGWPVMPPSEDVTDLVTNPSFEDAAAPALWRTNQYPDPRTTDLTGWNIAGTPASATPSFETGPVADFPVDNAITLKWSASSGQTRVETPPIMAPPDGVAVLTVFVKANRAGAAFPTYDAIQSSGAGASALGGTVLLKGGEVIAIQYPNITVGPAWQSVVLGVRFNVMPAGAEVIIGGIMWEYADGSSARYFDGSNGDADLVTAWLGEPDASASTATVAALTAYPTSGAIHSTEWSADGAGSARVLAGDGPLALVAALESGEAYTVSATARHDGATGATLAYGTNSTPVPATPGEHRVSLTFTASASGVIRLGGDPATDVWWDDVRLLR